MAPGPAAWTRPTAACGGSGQAGDVWRTAPAGTSGLGDSLADPWVSRGTRRWACPQAPLASRSPSVSMRLHRGQRVVRRPTHGAPSPKASRRLRRTPGEPSSTPRPLLAAGSVRPSWATGRRARLDPRRSCPGQGQNPPGFSGGKRWPKPDNALSMADRRGGWKGFGALQPQVLAPVQRHWRNPRGRPLAHAASIYRHHRPRVRIRRTQRRSSRRARSVWRSASARRRQRR